MTISVVQSGFATTATFTLPQPTTAGNTLIVCTSIFDVDVTVSNVTLGGSAGNFGQVMLASQASGNAPSVSVWMDVPVAAGQSSVTVSGNNIVLGTGFGAIFYYEVSGVTSFDQVTTNAGSGTSWTSSATGTTTSAEELWIGVACTSGSPVAPGSPWASQTFSNTCAGYQIVSSTGTATFSGTATSGPWIAAAVTFSSSPAGAIVQAATTIVNPGSVTSLNLYVAALTGAVANAGRQLTAASIPYAGNVPYLVPVYTGSAVFGVVSLTSSNAAAGTSIIDSLPGGPLNSQFYGFTVIESTSPSAAGVAVPIGISGSQGGSPLPESGITQEIAGHSIAVSAQNAVKCIGPVGGPFTGVCLAHIPAKAVLIAMLVSGNNGASGSISSASVVSNSSRYTWTQLKAGPFGIAGGGPGLAAFYIGVPAIGGSRSPVPVFAAAAL